MPAMAQTDSYPGLPFLKMHGLGNDFVVLDVRGDARVVTPALARALGDRHRGVGFDQLAVVETGTDTDLALTFWNADGSTAGACGNATRCIARREMELTGRHRITLRTERGVLEALDAGNGRTSVNMGQPVMSWQGIPLKGACDTLNLPIEGAPVATGMGNPHCTFFVDDADAVDLETLGAKFEHHPLFPERTNVQFAHVIGPDHLRMRVWERGVGVTLASGSSSCAVAVAAARRGLTGRKVRLTLDGGEIAVDWRDDGVWMTGPTTHVFSGELTPAFLDALG
jgi:diaminopimelate epimerase